MKSIKEATWSLHFWCNFLPRSVPHSFFAPRSALATVFWKSQNPGWRSVWVGRAECAGALGGDLRGVRRPCRRQELACQIHNRIPFRKSQICRSQTPLISPPSAPAHSARPPQIDRRPGFCDFQKTLASAERGAKNLCRTDIDVNLCQKCKLQDTTFIIFLFQLTFRIIFFQKSASRLSGEHIFEKQLRALSIEIFTFLTPKRPQK